MLSRCVAQRRPQSAAHPGGAVLRDRMGCVHCKHGQGRTALHFARAFSLGGLSRPLLCFLQTVVASCCSGAPGQRRSVQRWPHLCGWACCCPARGWGSATTCGDPGQHGTG